MKKFAVYMMLVLMTVLVVSCDSMSFDVEPSGYEGVDDLAACMDIYLKPERDNFCSSDDLALEFENYLLYFNDKLDFVEETLSINLGQSITSSSSDSLLTITINVDADNDFTSEIYDISELIIMQMIQEIDEVSKQFTIVRMNLHFIEESVLNFNGTFNGSRSENGISRTIIFKDESKTLSILYTDFIEEYVVADDGDPFTNTILGLEGSDSDFGNRLDINHTDKVITYNLSYTEASVEELKASILSLLPDYEFVEPVDEVTKD